MYFGAVGWEETHDLVYMCVSERKGEGVLEAHKSDKRSGLDKESDGGY
jgi:hypothetical protein